ncbi:MFS transporter [Paenibacillus sp. 7124]|uniref:MFS transporter n=1 Tax=Paenibacillus apii TaxID=1850370 RepID=A0A6M1PJI1_9BACL|nr:MFS transporter [Paenibacillus apii]NGM83727.1 MFS transporter [Paenibacillus apii]
MISPKLRNTALLVAGCYFMENLDSTIVTTAVPAMSRALQVSSAQMGLIVTAYMVTLAVFIPISGWLAEKFGTRLIFLSAIAIFTLASLACALSPNLGTLVAARVLQGFGGAMMVPVGRVVVIKHTEKRDLLKIMSYLVWPGLISPAIAPLAGGLIITYASWEYLFLINLPLGIAGFIAAWKLIEDETEPAPSRLDVTGVALTGIGVGGLTYAAHVLADTGVSWSKGLLLTAVFLAVSIFAVRHLLTVSNPIVELRILSIPTFRSSQLGSSLYWMMVGSAPFMLTLLFQNVFGWSPTLAGGIVLFIFIGNIGIKPATTFLINRFGFRRVLIVSTAIGALTMILNGLITPAVPIVLIALLTLISGIVRSTALTAYTTIAYSDISPENTRHANALASTMQNLAAAFGIASATVALRAGEPIARWATGSSGGSGAYTVSFFILGIIASLATLEAVRLDPAAGSVLRRKQPGKSLNSAN